MAKKTPTIDLFLGAGDKRPWYWRLLGRNGEIVASSESYSTRSSALRAARRLPAIVAKAVIVT